MRASRREREREREHERESPGTNWAALVLMFLGGLLLGSLLTGGAVGAWAVLQMRASRAEAEAMLARDRAEVESLRASEKQLRASETQLRTQAEQQRQQFQAFMDAQRSGRGLDKALDDLRRMQEQLRQAEKLAEPPR